MPFSGSYATAAGVQNVYFEPCLDPSVTNKDTCQQGLLTAYGLTPGQPFPNNTIPHQLFDSNAVRYLNSGILPKPTKSNGLVASEAQPPINVRDDVVRVDHKINDRWQILGHYLHDSVTQASGGPELGWDWYSYNTVTSTLSNPSNSAALKMSGTINPNLLVEASMNYDGNIINITNSSRANLPSGWNVATFWDLTKVQQGKAVGLNSVPSIQGFGNPYGTAESMGNAPWHNAAEDYEPKLDVSYTVGKHAMKYGFSYNRYTKNQQVNGNTMGNFGTIRRPFRQPVHGQRCVLQRVHGDGYRADGLLPGRRCDGYAARHGCQLRSAGIGPHRPLCKPDAFDVHHGQLARDSAPEPAARSSL